MPKKIKSYDLPYKSMAVKLADKTSVDKAAIALGISSKNIYNWRKDPDVLRTAPKITVVAKPKRKVRSKPKKRVQRTDDQKRLILRDAKNTSVAEAAERFNVSGSSIHAWKAKGLRPARVKKRSSKRQAPTRNGHGPSPIAFNTSDQDLVQRLRTELGVALDENAKLKEKVVQFVLHE